MNLLGKAIRRFQIEHLGEYILVIERHNLIAISLMIRWLGIESVTSTETKRKSKNKGVIALLN